MQRDNSAMAAAIYRLYRDFFDHAEKKRRWRLREDIPWDRCNPSLDPAIADVVESFCAVELFLPDYVGKFLPQIRASRGCAWFTANWGYEESKHSLALGDWLLRSGHRSEEQMADLESEVFRHEWNLPMDSPRGMVCYSMTQELATWLHYRSLRLVVGPRGDPALYHLLGLISIDERAQRQPDARRPGRRAPAFRGLLARTDRVRPAVVVHRLQGDDLPGIVPAEPAWYLLCDHSAAGSSYSPPPGRATGRCLAAGRDRYPYLSFSRTGAELLFQVFADRYERRSLLITSNLPFGEWGQVFQGERMTAALLDRLTHRCHIFEMNGESYRFRESMKAKKDKDARKGK